MKGSQLFLLFILLVLIPFPNSASSQQVLDYRQKVDTITFGDKKLEVKQEASEALKKRVSRSVVVVSTRNAEVSKARIMELAKEFSLLQPRTINPRLVFTTDDVNYWFAKKLDEARLTLEFAARKLILEQADEQRVVIADRRMLDEAAQQVIPLLQKPPEDPISDRIRCAGDTSEVFVKQSWEALTNKDYEKALICTNNAINKWTRQADAQQLKATGACGDTPQAGELKSYFAANWALSDIATAWFIRGEVFRQQAKWAPAREAYKTVIDKYGCAFAWDTRGWFWRTSDTAQEKYDEIRLK